MRYLTQPYGVQMENQHMESLSLIRPPDVTLPKTSLLIRRPTCMLTMWFTRFFALALVNCSPQV